ncbi:superkiller protein 3 [Cryptococcus neoformans Bt15]|nr:superkiller protein 3 [Cryptococcus neoformans var. grubii Bt15]
MATKSALKSIKAHLGEKNSESALYEATELLKSIGPDSAEADQVLVFRGLALTQLQRLDEAEKSYLHAYKLNPNNPLASVGLRRLYHKDQSWEKLATFLEMQVQTTFEKQDDEKLAEVLKELLEVREQHGPEEKLYRTLDLLLPSSPVAGLLQSVTPPQGTYIPLAIPVYPATSDILPALPSPLPHPVHLVGSLSLVLVSLIRSEIELKNKIDARVDNERKRLGAGTERDVRKKVDREILGTEGMRLVDLWKEVAGHPQVEEEVRREVEVREFEFWKRLVAALPIENKIASKESAGKVSQAEMPVNASNELVEPALFKAKQYVAPSRTEALSHVNALANGFVLLDISVKGAEEGWRWVLEGKDEPTLFYDIDLLHKYLEAFPNSPMACFIEEYCRWFKRPLPESEEDASKPEIHEKDEKIEDPGKHRKSHKGGRGALAKRQSRRAHLREMHVSEDVEKEEREELFSSMTKLVDQLPMSIFAHRVMARIALEDEDWSSAISFAERARKLLTGLEAERSITLSNIRADLDTVLGVALVPHYPPKHHARAARILETVLKIHPTNNEARFARAQIYETAGQWSDARQHFEKIVQNGGSEKERLDSKEEVGWCLANEGKLEEGRDILEEVIEVRDTKTEKEKEAEARERGRTWWRLGRTEWMIGDEESKRHAEEWFMASIRAYPDFAASYTSLGVCYSFATPPDNERALKCFQRAFELDATEADAAYRLANGYADEDEWARVRTIAVRVMEGEGGLEGVAGGEVLNPKGRFAPQNGWAWKALGSSEMHYKKYSEAAAAYQIALRADDQDVSTWIMLGENYVKCGRHMAGLKTFDHALTLDPNNWRALYDIGQTQSQLGAFDKAIEAYQKVLEITQDEDVGVIAALAEANLSLGRQTGAGGFRERSRRACHRAIELAMKVLKSAKAHKAWGWKLIGDATYELSGQESNIEEAQDSFTVVQPVLTFLVEDDTDRRSTAPGVGHAANLLQDVVSTTTSLRASIFAFAYRAHILKNEPRVIDPALYDYASALHTLAGKLIDSEERTQCLKTAISAVRAALDRNAGDERLWNALGVICATAGPQVAQHAFVVSLELYSKDPVVWVNLGYLYLHLDDLDLANQCFLKTQIIDPDSARAWYGQGLLADRHGDKEHAKALFSHSVTLSAQSLLEADLALAAATFAQFFRPNASVDSSLLHQPAFALKHYCHQRPSDSTAAHLYALICEQLGLVEEAALSLENAATVLEEEFERVESREIETLYSVALCNLGRVRFSAGEYLESLDALNNCWELIASSSEPSAVSLKPQCRLLQGLAFYWLGRIDESLEAFQASLDEATQNQDYEVKEKVAVLLSRTLWGLGGNDAKETAKNNLMECLSRERPSLEVISTLAAIALVSSDEDLTSAAVSELLTRPITERAKDPSGQANFVLYLHAISEGREEDAHKALQSASQAAPTSLSVRNRLAEALIKAGKSKEALGVLTVKNIQEGTAEVKAKEERLLGIGELMEGDAKGMKKIVRSVMLAPWEDESWQALAWGKKVVEEAGPMEAKGNVATKLELTE